MLPGAFRESAESRLGWSFASQSCPPPRRRAAENVAEVLLMSTQETETPESKDCNTCPDHNDEAVPILKGRVGRRRFLGSAVAGVGAFVVSRFLPPLGVGPKRVAEASHFQCDVCNCWVFVRGFCYCMCVCSNCPCEHCSSSMGPLPDNVDLYDVNVRGPDPICECEDVYCYSVWVTDCSTCICL